jgi:AcrR family transcriptional regulator
MTAKKLNKHEIKTKETRELLLQAAETIFVRDGYEGAELGEIATLAGRTKGAIYAQFRSKEDIFLALIEGKTKRYRTQMEKMLTESTSQEENLAAFRQFCLGLTEDRAWALLFLEFKLFALRHPDSKARLQSFYDQVIPTNSERKFAQLLGSAGKGKDVLSRSIAVHTIQPLLSALAVEAKFAPTLLEARVLKKVAARIFDALLQTP